MRRPIPLAAPRLLLALALLPALACTALSGARAETAAERHRLEEQRRAHRSEYHMPSGSAAAAHAHPPAAALPPAKPPPPPVVPLAPPPPPVLPPPIIVPTRKPPPPTPPPITSDAPDTVSKIAGGLRITFGPDRFDLNPEANAAIIELTRAPQAADGTFTVTAFAAGGDDPSAPRRLSLSRALSARSALMEDGIASARIYVKALGASAPAIAAGPADRVDIVVAASPVPAAPPPAPPPAAPANKAAP